MPARKNRPGKHGVPKADRFSAEEQRLAHQIQDAERVQPYEYHWVSWLDVNYARNLAKLGYLTEQGRSGMFQVTMAFRVKFLGWVLPTSESDDP